MITFVSHTNRPGGGELALRRYLDSTTLPVRLVTMEPEGVWEGVDCDTVHAPNLLTLRRTLRGGGLVVANSMRMALHTAVVAPPATQLVYWVRDSLTESAMSRLALALTKNVTARRTVHYIANSKWTARSIQELAGVEPMKIDVVYSMCGVQTTDHDTPTMGHPIPGKPLRLLFLGRLSPWKAPDVAVRALAVLEKIGIDATLTIAGGALFGEHAYAADLAGLVAAEPRATLAGHVDDVSGLMAAHDLLIHCSTKPEPFGQVIVQGLAAGLPVVATAPGGPAEILADSPIDLLYRAGDVDALASTVAGAVHHYGHVTQWAIARSQDFSDERTMSQADTVFRNLQAIAGAGRSRHSN